MLSALISNRFLVLMGLLAVIQILFILQSSSETGTEGKLGRKRRRVK